MGSDSDLPTMKAAATILDVLQVSYEIDIVSAHRTPDKLHEYASTAEARGLKVVIAGAGGCLLYTSDAAGERSRVDLGGRRVIKKKKRKIKTKKRKRI